MPPWLRTLTRERRRTQIRKLSIGNSQVNLSNLHRLKIQPLIILGRTGFWIRDVYRVTLGLRPKATRSGRAAAYQPFQPARRLLQRAGAAAHWLICKSSPAAFFLRFILIGSILGLPTNLEPFIMVASTGLESLFFNCHLQIVESGNLDKRFSCTFSLLKVNGPCPPEDHQNI